MAFECPVCSLFFTCSDAIIELSCKHRLCELCFRRWWLSEQQGTCPLCRQDFWPTNTFRCRVCQKPIFDSEPKYWKDHEPFHYMCMQPVIFPPIPKPDPKWQLLHDSEDENEDPATVFPSEQHAL